MNVRKFIPVLYLLRASSINGGEFLTSSIEIDFCIASFRMAFLVGLLNVIILFLSFLDSVYVFYYSLSFFLLSSR